MDRAGKGANSGERYRFGPFRLDVAERRLLRDGEPKSLQPRVFDTLALLVRNAGHLLTKEELIAALWPDAVVEESNLTKNIWTIRKALGDQDGSDYIETVPRVGYRFVAPVRIEEADGAAARTPSDDREAAAEVAPPERVGPYTILSRLGSGAMGRVYRARDERLKREVAIKILSPSLANDSDRMRRFEREAQSAGSLNHPNITAVYDVGSHDGRPYIVTELLEGETLLSRLQAGPIAPRPAVEFAAQVADGLAAAHAKGIVHRDLKPANLFVTRDGRAKILDFGLAKLGPGDLAEADPSEAGTEPGLVLGTINYMSPEQMRGAPVDARADVFSLGAVLYEMVSGRRAFERPSAAETMIAVLRDAAPDLPAQSATAFPDLSAIVRKCLEKDPESRYPSARDLARDLRDAAVPSGEESPHTSKPPFSTASTAAAARGRRIGLWLAAAAAAAALSLALVLSKRPSAAPPSDASPLHVRPSIAVLGLRNLSGRAETDWLGTAISAMVTAELAAGERVRVVPAENVARRRVTPPAGPLSADTLSNLRSDLNADEVVLGSYVALPAPGGEQIRVDLLIQDARSGETVASVSQTGSEADLFSLVSSAGRDLRGKLGLTGRTAAEAAAVKASLPSNADATRLYAEGIDQLARGDAPAARDLLVRAAEADPGFSLAHAALSDAWSALGYDRRAEEEAQKAVDRMEGLSSEERLMSQARLATARRQWDDAIGLYQSLWKSYPDDAEYGLRLARAQLSGGRLKDSLATVENLRRLPPPQGDDPRIDLAEAAAAGALSDVHRQSAAAARAAAKAAKLDEKRMLARARLEEASVLDYQGAYPAARAKYEEARDLYDQAGDRDGAADAVRDVGGILVSLGDLSGGRALYQQALATFRNLGDRRGEASALTDLINLDWIQAGDLALVRRELEELHAIDTEVGDRSGIAWALNGIATVAWDQGDLPRALDLHRQALAISREIGKRGWEAWTLEGIADVLHSKGDLASAKKTYEDALAIDRSLKSEGSVARQLNNLSGVLFDMGNLPEAGKDAEQAMAIQERLGEGETRAESALSQVDVLIASGRGDEAARLAREADAQFQKSGTRGNQALAEGSLVRALLLLGRAREAEETAQRVRALLHVTAPVNEMIPARIACARADAASGRAAQARHEVEDLLRTADRIGWVNFQLEARLTLARIDLESGDRRRAASELDSLAHDADAKGFARVAGEARRLRGEPGPIGGGAL
ncbi:MAG TPA: protein kinase [Thermoanaerobaculia bacterium]|jgi:serine/threonine protein kinase/tetratricopeptide (TPR) repeat protein